jgi:hypothetical protein
VPEIVTIGLNSEEAAAVEALAAQLNHPSRVALATYLLLEGLAVTQQRLAGEHVRPAISR